MIGASGDMADFQQVKHMLQGLMSVASPFHLFFAPHNNLARQN